MDQPLGITIESLDPDTVCVGLSGELDFSRAYTFDEEMRSLEAQKPEPIVLDLRKLNFLDSAGLGRVLAVQRRRRDGRRLVVVRGSRGRRAAVRAERAGPAAGDGQRAARASWLTGVARPPAELARLLEGAERLRAEREAGVAAHDRARLVGSIASRYGPSAVSASQTSATASTRAGGRAARRAGRGGSRARRAARGGWPRASARSLEGADALEDRTVSSGWRRIARPLLVVELARLVEDQVGDAELADVVQQRGAAQVAALAGAEAQHASRSPTAISATPSEWRPV